MAEKFSITGQINLVGPANLKQVSSTIKKELQKPIKLTLDVEKTAATAATKIKNQIQRLVKPEITFTYKSKTFQRIRQQIEKDVGRNPIKIRISVENLKEVSDQISNYLKGRVIPINLRVQNEKQVQTAVNSVDNLRSATDQTSDSMINLGRQTAITVRRFGAYTAATAVFFKLSSSIRESLSDAIDFEKQLTKVRQVTGESLFSLSKLTDEIERLAVGFGVSSSELLNASQVLSQAGFSANQVRVALSTLAKTDLSPTFDSIEQSTEGAIAVLNQFGLQVEELEGVFDSLNTVAAKFAVESGDLITAIRTAGGVFASTGDSVEDLEALFTAVRQTTRASASSIAVGLRTISTRLQRGRTQNFLRDLGIDLRFAGEEARKAGKEGLFVGVFESFRRISNALRSIPRNDPRFAQIAEELGGFRQIDKVIPLITQFELAERVRGEAIRATGSLTKDAIVAQESFANQLAKTREEFDALIRTITQSETFRSLATIGLTITKVFVRLAESIELVSAALVTGLAGASLNPIRRFFSGFGSNISRPQLTFLNSGGFVPGVGNRDSVPAMLTPGEYVINKKAAKALGDRRLDILNKGRIPGYNTGGKVRGYAAGGKVSPQLLTPGVGIAGVVGIQILADNFGTLSDKVSEVTTSLTAAAIQFSLFGSLIKNSNSSIPKYEENIKKLGDELGELRGGFRDNAARARRRAGAISAPSSREVADAAAELSKQQSIAAKSGGLGTNTKAVATARQNLEALQKERKAKLDQVFFIRDEQKIRNDVLKSEISNKEKLIKAEQQQVRSINNITSAISGVSAGLVALSSLLDSFSSSQLARFREGESIDLSSARTSAGIGGGARGFATGAIVGGVAAGSSIGSAALGSIATATGIGAIGGPPGILLAAGLAALGAGVYSTVSALKEFDKQVKAVQIDRFSKDLSSAIGSLESGQTSPFLASSGIVSNLGSLRGRLRSETDQDLRTDINSAINNSLQGIQLFINKARDASVSFEQFSAAVPTDTLEFFARRTGQSFDDLVASIKSTIKAQDTFSSQFTESVLNAQAFETRIRTEIAITNAIKGTISNFGRLNSNFAGLSGRGGSGAGQNVLGAQLSNIGAVNSLQDLSRRLNEFVAGFGKSSASLVSDTIDASRALKVLPSLLLQVRRQTLSGSDKPIIDSLADQLDKAGIGVGVRDSIIAQIDQLGGPNNDDAKIIDAIGKDLTGVLTTITNSLQGVGSSLQEASNRINDELNNLASGLQEAQSQFESARGRRISAAGLPATLSTIISERPNFGVRQNALSNQQNIATGGRGAQQVFNDLVSSQQRLVTINNELANTSDPEKQRQLVNLQAQQIANIRNANSALDFLADATRRASVLEAELNKERSDRATRGSFAERIAFGSAGSNRDLARNIAFARQAGRTGSLAGIPEQFREELLSFLKSLGDTTFEGLGGFSGQDIIDVVTRNQLAGAGIDPRGITAPSDREGQIVQQISAIFTEAQRIEEARAQREIQLAQNFLAGLNNNFTSFLNELKQIVTQERKQSIDDSINSLLGERNRIADALDSARDIESLSGVDPETLRANFEPIISAIDSINKSSELSTDIQTAISDLARGSSQIESQSDTFFSSRNRETANNQVNRLLENITQRFGSDLGNELKGRIDDGALRSIAEGSFLGGGAFSQARVFEEFDTLLKQVLRENTTERERATRELSIRSVNVGGGENVTAILRNRDKLTELINSLPDNVKFNELGRAFENLTNEINILRRTRRTFNSGGVVPGVGNTDTVPAMLTPGEVVLNKAAVQRIGLQNALSLNSGGKPVQKFNQGGLVQSQDMSGFSNSINVFLTGVTRLAESLSNIPTEIEMRGTHRVEVVVMGAQVLNEIMPSVSKLVEGKIHKAMNDFVAKRFPEQGPYTGVI